MECLQVYLSFKASLCMHKKHAIFSFLVFLRTCVMDNFFCLSQGHYSFTVCVRSDSYLGMDLQEDIKLEVCEAKEAPTEHPQWEFEDDEEESESKDEESDEEFATDDDYDEDED